MGKIKLQPGIVTYPMPVSLVGAKVKGVDNFIAIAWLSMVGFAPPRLAVTLNKCHYTNQGIKDNGVFSVNFPSVEHMQAVDYCGLVSGAKTDKSKVFKVFYGQSEAAPMVADFKLNVECKLAEIVDNGQHETFIGDIVGLYAEESALTEGKIDLQKLAPLLLGQGNTTYYSLGEKIGQAWSIGKTK